VHVRWAGGDLYIDPFQLKEKKVHSAALVLVTNPRLGHLSPEDIRAVSTPETLVAGPEDAIEAVPGRRSPLRPGEVLGFRGLTIRAVAAYNLETGFFPRVRGWLGYLIDGPDLRLYHAGATDLVPEMADVTADVACLPVSGRYVMGPEDAVRAAELVGARLKVAMHVVGDRHVPLDGFVTGPPSGSQES
jgi:L-ascorbate metabolism protein UlaG (beta-lactamase superfamily)